MGEARRRRGIDPDYGNSKPHFTAVETDRVHSGEHLDEFSIGDRFRTVLDGCILCGRLADVAICPDHGASVNDTDGGYTILDVELVGTPQGASLVRDGGGNHLCADCVAKHGTKDGAGKHRLSDALHRRLERLGDKIWAELKLRYGCPLCEIRWIRRRDARAH